MSKKSQNPAAKIAFTALGFTALGLMLGLHSLIWRIWLVLSGLWVAGTITLVVALSENKGRPGPLMEPTFWAVVLVPPVALYFIVRVLDWVLSAVRPNNK